MYRAVYSFSANDPDILNFIFGDEFDFVSRHDEHWIMVRSRKTGKTGLAPKNYLSFVQDERVR